MGFESYYESPFTQQAEAALEGIKRMTELRIVLKEQERSSLNISDMDGFIQDSGRLLRDVAHDNRVFYDANPKALFHDMELMVEIRGKLQQAKFPSLVTVDEVIMTLMSKLKPVLKTPSVNKVDYGTLQISWADEDGFPPYDAAQYSDHSSERGTKW